MPYKILLPFDGSRCSIKAAEYVAQLMASGGDIACTVLFVTPFTRDLAGFLGIPGDEYSVKIAELADKIRRRASFIFESRGLHVQTALLEGDPVQVICKVAKREGFDEIVMGSRGYTGIKKIIKGGLSREVAQKAACPVRIIK
ncbi:MAG: universal stress protein [Bacillota bacterium]